MNVSILAAHGAGERWVRCTSTGNSRTNEMRCRPGPIRFVSLVVKHLVPIGSMYGIYANIWGILMVNVTIYTIHGSYGLVVLLSWWFVRVRIRKFDQDDQDLGDQNITKDMRVLANLRRSYIWQFFLDFVGHLFSLGEDIIEQSGVCSISWCQDLFGQEIMFRDKGRRRRCIAVCSDDSLINQSSTD